MGKSVYLSDNHIETLQNLFELLEYNNALTPEQQEAVNKIKGKIEEKINLDDYTKFSPGESARCRWDKRIIKETVD